MRLKGFTQVTDPMGSAEVAHKGKDVKIITTYMWGRWIRNLVIAPLIVGLAALITQGIETLATNAEANRTLTDTLATLRDWEIVVRPSFSIYEEGTASGANKYLKAEIVAPPILVHLLEQGWTIHSTGSMMVKSKTPPVTTSDGYSYAYSSWIGTTAPLVNEDGKIVVRFSEHNIPPDGVFVSGTAYYMEFKYWLESPGQRVLRNMNIQMGWYDYQE